MPQVVISGNWEHWWFLFDSRCLPILLLVLLLHFSKQLCPDIIHKSHNYVITSKKKAIKLFLLIEAELLGTNISFIFYLSYFNTGFTSNSCAALCILRCTFTFALGSSSQEDLITDEQHIMTYTYHSTSN